MRPLEHLNPELDYKLFEINEELYDRLLERGGELLEQCFNEYMSEFPKKPKKTLEELNKDLAWRKDRLWHLEVRLNAPAEIVAHERALAIEIKSLISNKMYCRDKADMDYKISYEQRQQSFYNSDSYKNLLKEIHVYNEKCAKDIGIDLIVNEEV